MNRPDLGAIHAGETIFATFDFAASLRAGETVSSASASKAVYSGESSALLTLGATTVSSPQVRQALSGATEGATFLVTVTALTSLGQILVQSGFLSCVPAAN